MKPVAVLVIVAVAILWMSCSTDDSQSRAAHLKCAACRHETTVTRKISAQRGSHRGTTIRTIRQFHCDECRGDVEVFEKDGKKFLRCSCCTAEGICCD